MKAQCDKCQWGKEQIHWWFPEDIPYRPTRLCLRDPDTRVKEADEYCRHFLPDNEEHVCGNCEWSYGKIGQGGADTMCMHNAPDALIPQEWVENRYPLDWKCNSFQPRGAFKRTP